LGGIVAPASSKMQGVVIFTRLVVVSMYPVLLVVSQDSLLQLGIRIFEDIWLWVFGLCTHSMD
jgi:hypothetical protein